MKLRVPRLLSARLGLARLEVARSIRFRLSALYSAVVFGLGGIILTLLYVAVRWQLTRQTETRLVIRGQQVQLGQFRLIVEGYDLEIDCHVRHVRSQSVGVYFTDAIYA